MDDGQKRPLHDPLDARKTQVFGEAGTVLDEGRYELLEKAGQGGMGVVWRAMDHEMDEQVAVKMLPPEVSGSKTARRRLREEARLARRLAHPNIVRLHNLEVDRHATFLVMEYVQGPSLEDVLNEEEKMPLEDLAGYVPGVCKGLDNAHKANVLHRDIKPANILIAADGTPKITDFGIAREMRDTYVRVTGREATTGTFAYMSPEQLIGGELDARSDVYSLAATLYELISGEPPFCRGNISLQIRTVDPRPIDRVKEPVMDVLLRALAKDLKDRYASADDFAQAFTKAVRYRGRTIGSRCLA